MNDEIKGLKDEILSALQRHADENRSLVERVVADQIDMRAEVAGLRVRVEALEHQAGAFNARHSAHERAATSDRHAIASALQGIKQSCDAILALVADADVGEAKQVDHGTPDP